VPQISKAFRSASILNVKDDVHRYDCAFGMTAQIYTRCHSQSGFCPVGSQDRQEGYPHDYRYGFATAGSKSE